ncbi:hypothetical protein [Zestomonas thermotolerans]|uniref:PA4575 family protein n=1 Tax=Zestomonas thermotolerans TaxID=157784 RepID=UPI000488C933|nr:hypothetical protein [Pseudomonas thermotolerans]
MSRSLCLTRQCLGLVTRIECAVRPLSGESGLWTLICAAGIAGNQPTAVKAQGPFPGPCVAESVLDAIVENLLAMGYEITADSSIWCLHIQAELRRVRASRGRCLDDCQPPPG